MIALTGYTPKHFSLQELVPQFMWLKHRQDKLLRMIDSRLLWTMDRLRELYGPVYVNNWHWGGNNQFSCLRPFDCAVGAALSEHKFGRAADLKFKRINADEIRQHVLADPYREEFKFITSLELGVSWFHFGVSNYNKNEHGVLTFTPQ